MSRINTNVAAVQAIRHLQGNYSDLTLRLERLATGLRINRGRDDPAGLIASERLRLDTRAIQQAVDNSSRAANVVSTTEGSLSEVNSLLLDLQGLVVEAANKGAITSEELNANQLQIDSILESIDRISENTTFGGKKLLDGSLGYILSSLPTGAFEYVSVFAARMPSGGVSRSLVVNVTQSAETGRVSFVGTNTSAPSTTSATSIEVQGMVGTSILSFASGTTLANIKIAINNNILTTGVSAIVSTPSVTGVASALILSSTSYGSDAFVSVTPIRGNFIASNSGTVSYDWGADATVLVDGQPAYVNGLRADVHTAGLDTRIYLTAAFAQSLSSATFAIQGGGTLFQLSPEVTPNGQIDIGFGSVRTTQLGNAVVGRLNTLRSGGANDLASENYFSAQEITGEAIDQISSYRGRLGNFERNTIDPNISSLGITLENVIASESVIRDADMAEELAALTRAQILVQSTQKTLQIANTLPNLVLALLG